MQKISREDPDTISLTGGSWMKIQLGKLNCSLRVWMLSGHEATTSDMVPAANFVLVLLFITRK